MRLHVFRSVVVFVGYSLLASRRGNLTEKFQLAPGHSVSAGEPPKHNFLNEHIDSFKNIRTKK